MYRFQRGVLKQGWLKQGPAIYFWLGNFCHFFRHENSEAWRPQLSYVPKNSNPHTTNDRRANRDGNEALSSVLTNLYSDQLASERIANRHSAMANFPFGSYFAHEESLLEPTTPVFQPRV